MTPDDAIAAVGQNRAATQRGEQPPIPVPPIETILDQNQMEAPVDSNVTAVSPLLAQDPGMNPGMDPSMLSAIGRDVGAAQAGEPDLAQLLSSISNQ